MGTILSDLLQDCSHGIIRCIGAEHIPRCSLWTVLAFTTFHHLSPHALMKGGALTTFHRKK